MFLSYHNFTFLFSFSFSLFHSFFFYHYRRSLIIHKSQNSHGFLLTLRRFKFQSGCLSVYDTISFLDKKIREIKGNRRKEHACPRMPALKITSACGLKMIYNVYERTNERTLFSLLDYVRRAYILEYFFFNALFSTIFCSLSLSFSLLRRDCWERHTENNVLPTHTTFSPPRFLRHWIVIYPERLWHCCEAVLGVVL